MKRAVIALSMILWLAASWGVITETASLENFLIRSEPNCAYDNWISHIAEGIAYQNYNIYAPYDRQTNGFGDFRIPSTNELNSWGSIVDLFLTGQLDAAQTAVDNAGFPYQVVVFNDTDSGRTYHMLREIPSPAHYDDNGTPDLYDDENGAFAYGWGLYIYNPEGTRPIIVTVPHPTDDFPTPIMGYEALNLWNANFLLISGAGREVKWTNIAPYNNSKSISDPTRYALHPYNVAYKKFADKIRADYGRREHSFQVHSYDWNAHQGYTDNQISAGYNKLCPNLPIRDLSSRKRDLINLGNHLMIPANTIGIHEDVNLNQYYSVNYSTHDFTFSDGEYEYPVNDNIDLPAYSQNQQMLYTLSGWSDYDVFEPFFHVEMDELPNAYDETVNNYKWFYGWNEAQGRWDFDNLFTNFRQYYKRWVIDLDSLWDEVFTMNDNLVPNEPTDLTVVNQSYNYITLGWTKTDSYDFDSYEILYATSPIGVSNFQIFDRNNAAFLASPDCEQINVTGLSNTATYYFKIRARDKNSNLSPMSNEVTTIPAPANITTFTAHGMDESVRLYWALGGSSNLEGFKIFRKPVGGIFQMIASYETDPSLQAGANSYEYWDHSVANGEAWVYRISMVNSNAVEFIHNVPLTVEPRRIYTLLINNGGLVSDEVYFAQNPGATDGQDNYYDVSKANPGTNYVWMAFWQPYWGSSGTQLSREVKGAYDVNNSLKTWTLRVRSDILNQALFISLPQPLSRTEKLYLYDATTGAWHNLQSGPYQFMVTNTNVRTMTLYWGNLQPKATPNLVTNQVLQGSNTVNFGWSTQNSFLIDHMDIYLKNATDSLAVLMNASPTSYSYTFIIPQATSMPQTKLYIDVVATDGIRTTYASPYTHAIVPRMNLHLSEPGWQTRANPFIEAFPSVEEFFGEGSSAFMPDLSGGWIPTGDFLSGQSYWVNAGEYVFYNTTSAVLSGEQTVALNPGWNLIANPHLCAYDLSSLRFTINGALFRYSEMIAQQLISRGVYVYRGGRFELANRIEPYESFYIKSYAEAPLEVVLSFYPYYEAPQIAPPNPGWELIVTAEGSDTDSFKIGASAIGTESYDYRVDLPKPPAKTLFPSTLIYLNRVSNPSFLDAHLQEEFQNNFSGESVQSRLWNFSLDVSDTTPVQLGFSTLNIPASWPIWFVLDGVSSLITNGSSYTFNPPAAGTYHGYIRIYNQHVANSDLVQVPLSGLKVFPNPFNPSTTIAFSIPQSQDVSIDIYNLKGQKVHTLHRGMLNAGTHNLAWNAKDDKGLQVASGIYFARVKTKGSNSTIKMVLMK
jgi:hypothetical protein